MVFAQDSQLDVDDTLGDADADPNSIPECGTIGEGQFSVVSLNSYIMSLFLFSQWIVSIAATFFDWIMFQSISDSMYRINFVENGWEIVRDPQTWRLSLCSFTSRSKQFSESDMGQKKQWRPRMRALFINFSMFFAKVIIDSGNILACIL